MGMLEIVLLIAGVIIFTLSFLIPARREEFSAESKELAQDEIKKLVSQEMDSVKGRVDDAVGEAVDHAVEKTERSLERLSNEKIMAVSEYSDTVIKDIHKNHEEVVFLYDMLNDKHTSLKNTVAKVNETVKAVEETTRGAEAAMGSLKQMQEEADKKAAEAAKVPVDTGIMRIARLQGKLVEPVQEDNAQIVEEFVVQPISDEGEVEIVAQTVPIQNVPIQNVPIQNVSMQPASMQFLPAQATLMQSVPVQPMQMQTTQMQPASMQSTPIQTVSVQAVPIQSASVQSIPIQNVSIQPAPMQSASVQSASMQGSSMQSASMQSASMQSVSVQNVSMQEEPQEAEQEKAPNNNERILALYEQGKSEIAIARELGLGVGEVSLVIRLYRN